MKITLFISSLYGGGAERVTCNLANYLSKRGHEVEILTISETRESYELDKKVKVVSLLPIDKHVNKCLDILLRFPRLYKYLKKTKNDLYIVMLPITTIMLLAFRKLTKAKVIASERSDPSVYPSLLDKSLKKLAWRADGWVFQTDDAQKWYGDAIKDCKIEVIPNAINSDFVKESYKGEKRKVIASVGRLNDQKNFSLLIRAFAKIKNEYPDYSLIIYGEGDKRKELEALIENLGLEDSIKLPGNIQNIVTELEKNSIFVLSSDYEGMPNALMEAMALGLPCISTDCPCGGPRYLIQDGVNGLLVPIRNEDAIIKAMAELLADKTKRIALGSAATEIQKKLAPDKIYGEWERFIKLICEV